MRLVSATPDDADGHGRRFLSSMEGQSPVMPRMPLSGVRIVADGEGTATSPLAASARSPTGGGGCLPIPSHSSHRQISR